MMSIIKMGAASLVVIILVAACQPIAETKPPLNTEPENQKNPTPDRSEVEYSDSPTKEIFITIEPTFSPPPTGIEPSATHFSFPPAEEIMLPAGDMTLAGTVYYPQSQVPKWPGVILIHMLHGDQTQWNDFPAKLSEAGYAVLSIDLRGHGGSGGEVDWDLAIKDLQQVWYEFSSKEEIDQSRTAFIGASIGANLSLIASTNEPLVRTAVLLSPGLSYAGVETDPAMEDFGDRPVLIVASNDDTYAANSSKGLADMAPGESNLVMYQDAGHGTLMFRSEPELAQIVIGWLDQNLK